MKLEVKHIENTSVENVYKTYYENIIEDNNIKLLTIRYYDCEEIPKVAESFSYISIIFCLPFNTPEDWEEGMEKMRIKLVDLGFTIRGLCFDKYMKISDYKEFKYFVNKIVDVLKEIY